MIYTGFNYFGFGNVHPCGIKDKKVYYTLPSGVAIHNNTSIDFEIPEQMNLFVSDTVMFLLYHEDKKYVGRKDGSISIYRTSDELLVGLQNWKAPAYAETMLCGLYNSSGMYEIHLDLRDKRTVYILGGYRQGVLKKPAPERFHITDAVVSANAFGQYNNYSIFDERGDPVEADFWPIQEEIRRRDCAIFL